MVSKARRFSFFNKQLIAVLAINTFTLAVTAVLLHSNFIDSYKQSLVDVTRSKAAIISQSTASALLFDDEVSAGLILGTLEQHNSTRFAVIFTQTDQVFSSYKRANIENMVTAASMLQSDADFIDNNLYVQQSITFAGEELGRLVLSVDTLALQQQERRYTNIVLWVFVIATVFALILNWRLQKLLTRPINRLMKLVRDVDHKQKYDARIAIKRNDDMGELFSGINSMLDTIEDHRLQLQSQNDKLESLVELRTEQLFHRANFDALTQLPNRHLLIDRIEHAIENATLAEERLAVMFLDLDRFKVINDSLGHSVGDQLLIAVAQKLSKIMHRTDSVCRWGGDEFVILLEHNPTHDELTDIAKLITSTLAKPIEISGHQLHVSTSIGIAVFPDDGPEAMNLLKHADISMYQAKEAGPAQYRFFDKYMLNESVERLSIETNLRKALESDQFHMVYQPQYDTKTQSISSMEALIRWHDGNQYIPPNEFLPVAEEIGLINALSLWVVDNVCQQIAQWRASGIELVPVAINLPASLVVQAECASTIMNILARHQVSPHCIEIEITEETFISSIELATDTLAQLKKEGVSVALDDFGKGYSCLSYISQLPLDRLKIDGSFVAKLGQDRANDGIVQAIITLGQSLNLALVGECVETASQCKMLTDLHCDYLQGYLLSRPLPPQEVAELMERTKSKS